MGLGGLIVVAVAVLLCITLLPALLAILGRDIDRPRWLASRLTWYHAPQVWEKWARTLSRHPIRALGYGGAVIAILTLPVFFIKIGLPSRHWWPTGTEAGEGLDALSAMGVAGFIQPVRVLVQLPEGRTAVDATLAPGPHDAERLAQGRPAGARGAEPRERSRPRAACWATRCCTATWPRLAPSIRTSSTPTSAPTAGSTLLDVILADTTSLTTATDVVHPGAAARARRSSAAPRA